jgi:hypothetical protein
VTTPVRGVLPKQSGENTLTQQSRRTPHRDPSARARFHARIAQDDKGGGSIRHRLFAYRLLHGCLVFLIRALKVFNLMIVKVPDARGHFVDQIVIMGD